MKSILFGLVVLIFFTFTRASASSLDNSETVKGLAVTINGISKDLSSIKSSLKEKKDSIQSRISQVSLVSPNLLLSPYHSLNLEEETKANEETLSFLKQSTKKEILNISSKISLVRVEKNDLKPKPYLKSFYQSSSKKIDELAKAVKPKQKNQETAFIHESILKNIKESVKETLPSLPSLPNLFSKKINEDKNNKTEETTISQKTKAEPKEAITIKSVETAKETKAEIKKEAGSPAEEHSNILKNVRMSDEAAPSVIASEAKQSQSPPSSPLSLSTSSFLPLLPS